ncbi:MAG: hypothetical protein JHD15_10820 [Phenylobacterium sp.]|uniref:hypothetical protein n=1 Tax=Phenylobacterium sp. TaxID=1871053 RepID=UPI001A1EC962|nr:hypothetical protein [Phenylobacterium sp.]MBJ7410835.1 hypothetical protein [Phenylobacterium sp.]
MARLDQQWDELDAAFAAFNPSVAAAFRHARAAGMTPEGLSSVNFPNRPTAYVAFQAQPSGRMRLFNASGEET